ncbi:MAG: SIR2 family protein, partial [Alphaproteobacteria bacterium]|nr:SIR2 family protein [Alphaproteobacteria bacterium]
MVAFIKDGMDIPDHLVHAQENGRVVFFCGAGISMPAGLPSFKKLVDLIYSELNISKEGSEVDYYHEERFDWVLGLLERRLIGGRMQVRKPLMDILQPESDSPGTTATHKALLQLATYQDRAQLVTTNFDQIFAKVIREQNLSIPEFQAPHMPESTSGQWGGLVYLHGLLPESYNASKLEHLVLTSGDFGSAYLTRQWAANFVNALLQNYIVCFVGYSLGDHLLQYLLTAPAHGESRHNVYAFADLDGDKQKEYERWRAKGVTPVFYNPGKDHAPLHHTLEAWAKIYSASTEGKKKIITEHAGVAPPSSSRSDYVVGRVLWALTDPVAAKHFREMKPVPPLEWLDPLLENSFGREDLPNFGITADSAGQSDEKFSFLRRPTPIAQVPLMSLFTTDKDYHRIGWDNTMRNFADWICRHLGDPNILRRIAKNGYELHDNFLSAINWAMYEIKMLESKKDAEGLARLADGASHAIPCKNMRVLWQLILSGKIKLSSDELDFRSFLDCVEKNGWTAMSRLEMRKMLTPYIKLDPPRFGESADASASSLKIADIVDCKIVLAGRGIHRSLDRHAENSAWNTALPDLLPDFTALLRDALDLVHIVGQANDSRDMSVDCQPSISPSLQIHRPSGWTALVHLSRNAWIAASESNPEKARSVAEQWMHEQYPPFKKLALFAATHAVISDEQALNWLLFENCRWLWADATRHEMSRLIVARAPQLPKNLLRKLESAIANGPPRDMFPEDLGVADFSERAEQIILFRLAKLQASGSVLGHKAADMLQKLQAKHPRIQLHKDALDEFYFRPIGVRFRQEPPLPTQQHELVDLIKNYHEHSTPVGNRWRAYCSDESPKALSVLQELANKNEWPKAEWRDALGAWARNEDFLNTSFSTVCDLLANAPNEMMQSPGGEFTFWMWEAAATVDDADERILALSDRIIRIQHSEYAE